jgi:hypothetical protein
MFKEAKSPTEDLDKTLVDFPQGNNLMRERTVLEGLKRYSNDKPLIH